jgi:dTDP-4-dehydrorhamnose reductase
MPGLLLLGKFGQLGWELHRTLAPLGDVVSLDYPEINLIDLESLDAIILRILPDAIINATAYTAVDKAESESEAAMAINALAPKRLAELAQEVKAAFIHFSTDYVFDGEKGSPYHESDTPNPLGMYGKSKLAGEVAVQEADCAYLILRTSWVYSLRRDSFVTKVLSWAHKQTSLRIVDDQISNPTWCRMLAEITAQLLAKAGDHPAEWINERRGLYHLAGSGYTSRFEWAKKIIEFDPHPDEQKIHRVVPAETREFPTPAQRPLYSALNCDRFTEMFSLRLPEWEEALKLAMVNG